MENEYICNDENVLENIQKIRNMTDEEFEEYVNNEKEKHKKNQD